MNVKFLGAAMSVTGTCHLITTDKYKILLDCGQFQGSKVLDELNEQDFGFDPLEIDFMILSHAHIDHSGRIPLLTKRGYKGRIFCTDATADLVEIMLKDSGYIHEKEAEWANRKAVSSTTKIPFIAKMTPNVTNMVLPARAAIEGGAAGVSAINTVKSITNIDFENMTAMPVVDGKSSISGYSGAAVKPIALRFVAQMLQDEVLKNVPISGIGGIETWRDAVEFLVLGCRNIQVTTAIMQYGYRIVEDMISGVSHYMDERGYNKLDDFIGTALGNIIPAEELNRDFKVIPNIDYKTCIGCGRCVESCYDGAHQAIDWDVNKRRPTINDECVGCHLCLNVCPVQGCITPGEIKWKEGRKPVEIALKHNYE